jgi:hypothetical protein
MDSISMEKTESRLQKSQGGGQKTARPQMQEFLGAIKPGILRVPMSEA